MTKNTSQEYVGPCSGFPSLSWLAKSDDLAFSGIRALVADVVAEMRRKLAVREAGSKVSLKHYRNSKLTYLVG